MSEPQARTEAEPRRIGTTFTNQELDQIDEWGFARKIRTRSEAIRQLVHAGLAERSTETATGR